MNYITSFLKYLFNPAPGSEFKFYIPLDIFIGLLIIGGIAFSIFYNKKRKEDFAFKRLFKKVGSRLVTFGLVLLVFTLIRYENIPYFSMRIWLYLTLLIFLYFAYATIKKYRVEYPKEKDNSKRKFKEESEKVYLPNKKR